VLRESLFEQLIDRYPEAAVMLDRQYRMAQRIQWFSSDRFYDGALRPANGAVASRSLTDLGVSPEALPPGLDGRVSFHDPQGAQRGNTNPIEAAAIARLVEQYVAAGVDRGAIGVIAPFRAQVTEITRRLPEVAVDTVDRFQGSAKELILISMTATGQVTEPIFDDHRRMNVAVTRAKRGLVLVGDRAALSSDAFYRELLAWAER
jgi:DNA replication ATP-dependent helicase Dna2